MGVSRPPGSPLGSGSVGEGESGSLADVLGDEDGDEGVGDPGEDEGDGEVAEGEGEEVPDGDGVAVGVGVAEGDGVAVGDRVGGIQTGRPRILP